MAKSKKLRSFVMLLLVFVLLVSAVNATRGLNVVLSNQDPDPVSPGNFVFVNIKVSNSGDESIRDANVRFLENENFRLAQGSSLIEELGTIPAFSSGEGSTSFVIAKYKLLVDEDTPLGLNIVKFRVDTDLNSFEFEFDVLVEDNNPKIQVNKFDIESVEPGESSVLMMEIENINSVELNDIVVGLDLDDVTDNVFTVASGTNEKKVNSLSPGEKASIEFKVIAAPDADSKPYIVPVNFEYEDSLGNNYTDELLGSINVFSTPQVSLSLDSQDVYTEGKGKVTLAIANFGTSTVKGTQIKIVESEDYEIISGEDQYVGDLNPDDFQTIQSEIFVKNNEAAVLQVQLNYLDSYNVENERVIEVPLKIYSDEELKKFGLSGNDSGGGSGFGSLILAIIVGIIAFYFGMRRGRKKAKK